MRIVFVLVLTLLVAADASASIAKWKHPDGRVGFAAKAADIPEGARIVSGSLDPEPQAAPARRPKERVTAPAAPADPDFVSICDMDQESIKQLAIIGLKAVDWDDPEMLPIRSGRDCAMRSAPGIAVRFLNACRRNVSRGIETEDQALERLFTNTLVDCADVPPSMAAELKVPDPGARR